MSANPGCDILAPLLRYVVLVERFRNFAMVVPIVRLGSPCWAGDVSILLGLFPAGDLLSAFGGTSCHGRIRVHWKFLKTEWRSLLVPSVIILLFR